MKNRIFLLIFCAALTSCATLGKYKPQTEVSNSLYGDVKTSSEAENIAATGWKEFFRDTLLQKYIGEAIQGNKDLQIASERSRLAEATISGSKMAFFPSLSLVPSYAGTSTGGNYSGNVNIPASASWQLNILSLANNLKSAEVSSVMMEDYRQAVMSKLVADVANAYFTLLMLDSQLETADQMRRNWEQSLDFAISLKDAGLADQVAVSQYEANLEDIRIAVLNLERQIRVCENSLCVLMGKEVGQKIVRGRLASQQMPQTLSAGIPVQLLALRPDVRAAQREVEIAFYAQKGALLNFFPKLSITGAVGLLNPFSGAVSAMNVLANITATLTAPIFSSGRNRIQYEQAKSQQTQARISFDKTILDAGKEVNDAMCEYSSRSQMAERYENRVAVLDRARMDTEYLMKNSFDKTYLDVLYANTTFFNAKLALIENRAKVLQSVVALYSALGGGVIE